MLYGRSKLSINYGHKVHLQPTNFQKSIPKGTHFQILIQGYSVPICIRDCTGDQVAKFK
jgi:hypothetical protein